MRDARIKNHARSRTGFIISFFISLTISFSLINCGADNNKIEGSGTIEADLVTVSAQVSGDVKEILVDEGARVAKHDSLAVINSTILGLQLEQAQKGVALAQTQLVLVTKGARIEDIEQAEAALVQAENNNRIASEDAGRMEALYKTGSVTQKQYDDAKARAAIAAAGYGAAQQGLNKIRNISRPEEVEAALIRRDQARIAVKLAEEELGYATITSPLSGIVTHKMIEQGELVFPGSALFSISDPASIHLSIYVTERELARVFIGQSAAISIDAYPDKTFPGEVIYISPIAEFTPKNVQSKDDRVKLVFEVKIRVPNPDEVLKPGMPADAVIHFEEGK
jgi:HlyD family secretion protein